MYESIVPLAYPWVVGNAESWIYDGTGLQAGDVIPALVGYEYDRRFDNGRTPAGLSVFARSPVALVYGSLPSWSEATTYRVPGAGRVFAVGTLLWTRALDPTSAFVNPAVQRMSANMLADAETLASALAAARFPDDAPPLYGDGRAAARVARAVDSLSGR